MLFLTWYIQIDCFKVTFWTCKYSIVIRELKLFFHTQVGQEMHVCITRIDQRNNELIISEKEAWVS